MQDKELFKEFVEFCERQPTNKGIDHSSWWSCAVGEFATHLGITDKYLSDRFTPKLLGFNIELYEKLNEPDGLATYGEFTNYIKTFL